MPATRHRGAPEHQGRVSADPEVVAQQMIGAVPMRRYVRMKEIPGPVAFFLGNGASTITGVDVPIAGGILVRRATAERDQAGYDQRAMGANAT